MTEFHLEGEFNTKAHFHDPKKVFPFFIYKNKILKSILLSSALCSCPGLFKLFSLCTGVNAFEESKSLYRIRVKPNDYNQILIPDLNNHDDESVDGESSTPLRCIHFISCTDPCARMDTKIMKHAFRVLERNAIGEHVDDEREKLNTRMTEMENTLKIIVNKLDDLSNK